MDSDEITLEVAEQKYAEVLAQYKEQDAIYSPIPFEKRNVKQRFAVQYLEMTFKELFQALDQIESVKRIDKRMEEVPSLIAELEAKIKTIEEDPEWHRRVNREEVKALEKELEPLRSELSEFPEDRKRRIGLIVNLYVAGARKNLETLELINRVEA